MKCKIAVVLLLALSGGAICAGPLLPGEKVARKLRLDPGYCRKVFSDGKADPVQRRMAFRLLLETSSAGEVLQKGLTDPDGLIRYRSLYECFKRSGEGSYKALLGATGEKDMRAASLVLDCAKAFPEKRQGRMLLNMLIRNTPFDRIRREALRVADFPFYREKTRLKDNPAHDHHIVKMKTIPLPQTGWKFATDPKANGHRMGFFKPAFNDRNWKTLSIGNWESQGFPGYNGIAWYRFKFTMPAGMEHNAVELFFGGVDESAWVWLNGIYVGQHDLGTAGWDQPFWLDVTSEIKFGKENILVVRVEDVAHAGGIWRPVQLEILK